jgi:hypothetical protein
VCALLAAGVGFLLRHFLLQDLGRIGRMSILVPFCACLYLALILGVFRLRQPLDIALSVARNYVPVRVSRFLGLDLVPAGKN